MRILWYTGTNKNNKNTAQSFLDWAVDILIFYSKNLLILIHLQILLALPWVNSCAEHIPLDFFCF